MTVTHIQNAEARSSLVFLARVADTAERYDDMVGFVRQILAFPGGLSLDERSLFCVAYKNATSKLRDGWRRMAYLEGVTKPSKLMQLGLIAQEKNTISLELTAICEEVLKLIDEKLIPTAQSDEYQVFYLKTRADYLRYLAQIATTNHSQESLSNASFEAYTAAHQLAAKALPATHFTRLGLALNYSVFFYDVRHSPERACHVAKSAFDAAIEGLDELNEDNYKESVLILQLLRDNLTIWIEELSDEDASPVLGKANDPNGS